MKIISIAALATLPFLFGCASTTIKTYSADFEVSPVETKDVGEIRTTPDGEEFEIKQQYKLKATITETTQFADGETVSKVVASPSVTTLIGSEAQICVGEGRSKDGTVRNGTQLEAKFEDLGDKYYAYLKATIQKGDAEPVSCSQQITIKK